MLSVFRWSRLHIRKRPCIRVLLLVIMVHARRSFRFGRSLGRMSFRLAGWCLQVRLWTRWKIRQLTMSWSGTARGMRTRCGRHACWCHIIATRHWAWPGTNPICPPSAATTGCVRSGCTTTLAPAPTEVNTEREAIQRPFAVEVVIRTSVICAATHTHSRLMTLCPGLPGWAGTRKVKPIWDLHRQSLGLILKTKSNNNKSKHVHNKITQNDKNNVAK